MSSEGEKITGETYLVIFSLAGMDFAFPLDGVKEIIRLRPITRLPFVPEHVRGVINLRGNVIPVLDMREMFGYEPMAYTKFTRVIVLHKDGSMMGMIVDRVLDIDPVSEEFIDRDIEKVKLPLGVSREFIVAVVNWKDRIVYLLDHGKLIDRERHPESNESGSEENAV